jgi:hypothetical protein
VKGLGVGIDEETKLGVAVVGSTVDGLDDGRTVGDSEGETVEGAADGNKVEGLFVGLFVGVAVLGFVDG